MKTGTKAMVRPILLVEDNPMDIDLTLQAFKENQISHPVVVCNDGDLAMQYIHDHSAPDDRQLPILVLLDLRMPKVDGIDILKEVRDHPVWCNVPFVILTTSREKRDIVDAYALGANSYIVKPVDFDAFADMVKTIKDYWLFTNEPPFL